MSDQPGSRQIPSQQTPIDLQLAQQQQAVTAALRGGVPQAYFNGFAIVQTASDMSVILMSNGNPILTIGMSYITAKSLIPDLQKAIGTFEAASKQTIKTINELAPDLTKQMQEATNVPKPR
jgi:hypothetical protein